MFYPKYTPLSLDLESKEISREWLAKRRCEQREDFNSHTDASEDKENSLLQLINGITVETNSTLNRKKSESSSESNLSVELRSWQHAGFLFGLGMRGKLKDMNNYTFAQYLYLSENHTTTALLVGKALGDIGTGDWKLTRTLAAHVPSC